jgi:P4 family phage/plasmid primase-like protien
MKAIDNLLDRLSGIKKSGSRWVARCPAHEDKHASLSIGTGDDGRILLKCHAGCEVERIVDALDMKVSDLFEPRTNTKGTASKPRIVAAYDYTDEEGRLLFQCVRFEPKNFKQRRPDPDNPGQWIWDLKGVRRVLYQLPDVRAALLAGKTIYVVEGEKDCDALMKLGFAATCNPMGAGKWLPEHTESLRGAESVVVIADNDKPGIDHAHVVANALLSAVKSVKLIQLPDREDHKVKDVSGFLDAGGTIRELQDLVDGAPQCDASTEPEAVLGQDGRLFLTPSQWFSQKYPALVDAHGNPVWEEADKDGVPTVKDIGEDFLAATLGGQGTPEAPTIFLPTEEKFYSYSSADGIFTHQHEPVLLARLSRELLECARACHGNCETQKLEFQFRDSGHLSGVLKKARGLLPVPHNYFSTTLTEFIPCANGMLRLTDKVLLPFDPKYRRRNKLAVPFDPTAKCPKFLNTLMRPALDDIDLDLLQRWCGLALIGENLAQKLLILIGTAGGGKGTFINVLVGIIGQINLATLRPHLLGERFELSRFLGKTLLYGADVADNFLNQRGASVLKSLTGYDPITLEFKNSNEQPSIICRFNVIVTCNSRLTVHLEGDTEAWRRRLAIIQYNKPKPERVIAALGQQILTEEAPGVLNWMLERVDKIRADEWQLRLTANQQAAVDNLLLESDGHAVFARECLSRDASQSLTVPDCFAAYVEFCNQRGWTALTKNKFGTVIGDVIVHQFGITPSHDIRDASGKSQRGWRGIALVENSPVPTEEIASEVSENHASDGSDTFFPVQPTKKLVEEFA